MRIIIKNVTGTNHNDWCIWELKRAGCPEGTIIEDARFHEKNNSCTWTSDSSHCIAYVGQTCEIITEDHHANN